MASKILISACLLGQPVRYNARGLSLESDILNKWQEAGLIVALCPEVAAGFPIPRLLAEIEVAKTGLDVLSGAARIYESEGLDVTETFVLGAEIAM